MRLSDIRWIGRREKAGAGGDQVFTSHVRALESGGALEPRQLESVWSALRAVVRAELKRRGIWESPPVYLGIVGGDRWEEERGGEPSAGALEEIVMECYSYIFVSRLRSLQAQLKVKPNIDGFVILNVRHFLHERQREHDPIGSRVFEVLRSAVRLAIAEGELWVLTGDERVRNDTVLGFVGEEEVEPRADPESLASLVAHWNDELLPDLITSTGRHQEEIVRRLRARLSDLSPGRATVRFKDLIDPLKADVRARWGALLALESEGTGGWMGAQGETSERAVEPDLGVEERQLFRKLIDCLLRSIERLEVDEKTRRFLRVLLQFERVQAIQGTETRPVTSLGKAFDTELPDAEEERPSLRKLGEHLGIPRDRFRGLYRTLGDLVAKCQAAISGGASVMGLEGRSKLEQWV